MSAKDIDDIAEAISKSVETLLKRQNFKRYIDKIAELIIKRTRLGYGVKKNEGEKTPLKSLSKNYVKQRQILRRDGELSKKTTAKKSNLTKTGQMLDNIVGVTDSDGEGHIEITGSRRDTNLSNAEVAEEVSKARPFLKMSNLEVKQVTDAIRKDLIAEVNKRLRR